MPRLLPRPKASMVRKCVLESVRIPVWVCIVIALLLIVINSEIHQLRQSITSGSSRKPDLELQYNTFHLSGDEVKYKPVQSEDQSRSGREEAQARIDQVLASGLLAKHHAGESAASGRGADTIQLAAPQTGDTDTKEPSDGEVATLAKTLEMRLARPGGGILGTRNCSTLVAMNNTRGACVDTFCPYRFHPSPKTRIQQLLSPRFRPSSQQLALVNSLADGVAPRKYFFVTAASSNHYFESQALVFNLRQFVFKKLHPDSYSFLYFDLGLKPLERKRVEKNCNCTVLSMNMKSFPKHTWKLMCYAWKPFIIRALLPKTEVLVYTDASIRFRDMDLNMLFAAARQWGAQFLASKDAIPNHTVQSTFDFYQEAPCMFWPFPELLPGFSVFHNEHFISRVVLDPWVSCAFNVSCMCPVDPHAFRICPHTERRIGQCHRFDLSSLTLQMAKLFGDKFGQLVIQTNRAPRVHRNERMDFFKD